MKSFWRTNKNDWSTRKKKKQVKLDSKIIFRYRSKRKCLFVFKRFFKWRSYIQIKQSCRNKKKIDRDDLIYKTGNKKKDETYDFQKFKTIRSFGREIDNNDLLIDDALEQQIRLKYDIHSFKESTVP